MPKFVSFMSRKYRTYYHVYQGFCVNRNPGSKISHSPAAHIYGSGSKTLNGLFAAGGEDSGGALGERERSVPEWIHPALHGGPGEPRRGRQVHTVTYRTTSSDGLGIGRVPRYRTYHTYKTSFSERISYGIFLLFLDPDRWYGSCTSRYRYLGTVRNLPGTLAKMYCTCLPIFVVKINHVY